MLSGALGCHEIIFWAGLANVILLPTQIQRVTGVHTAPILNYDRGLWEMRCTIQDSYGLSIFVLSCLIVFRDYPFLDSSDVKDLAISSSGYQPRFTTSVRLFGRLSNTLLLFHWRPLS